MKTLSRSFFSMPSNCLYFIGIPIFYFVFILAYQPFGMEEFLAGGKDHFTLHLLVTTLILFGVLVCSRLLLYFLRKVIYMNSPLYVLWCTGEVVFSALMFSILLGIAWKGEIPYFQVMTRCILTLAAITVYPYVIISLSIRIYALYLQEETVADEKSLIRFQDDQKRIRLIVASEAVLYIEAEENYVHIVHLDRGRVKDFTLRSSMRSLEEVLVKKGLVRCHRSYFVNPVHVKMVGKDSGGFALATLDRDDVKPIPVSKRYYEALSALL